MKTINELQKQFANEKKKVDECIQDAAIMIRCVEKISAERLKISFDLAEGVETVNQSLQKFKTDGDYKGFNIIIEKTIISANYHIADENGKCLCGKAIPAKKQSVGFVPIENLDILCEKCQDELAHK